MATKDPKSARDPDPDAAGNDDQEPTVSLGDLDALRTGEADARVQETVAGDARLQQQLDEVTSLAAELQDALAVAPSEIPAQVDTAIRDAISVSAFSRSRGPRVIWLRWAASAAAVLAAGLLVWLVVPDEDTTQPTADGLKQAAVPVAEEAGQAKSSSDAPVASKPPRVTPAGVMSAGVTPSRVTSPLDVDRSGRVDIVDAYLVARRLKSMQAPDPKWDFNGDGRIDGADVDFIATRAVRLGPPQKAQGRTGTEMKIHLAAVFLAANLWEAH